MFIEGLTDAVPYTMPAVSAGLVWAVYRAESRADRRRLARLEDRTEALTAGAVAVARVETALGDVVRRLDRIETLLDRRGNDAQ